jgi:hypothetical protein
MAMCAIHELIYGDYMSERTVYTASLVTLALTPEADQVVEQKDNVSHRAFVLLRCSSSLYEFTSRFVSLYFTRSASDRRAAIVGGEGGLATHRTPLSTLLKIGGYVTTIGGKSKTKIMSGGERRVVDHEHDREGGMWTQTITKADRNQARGRHFRSSCMVVAGC